MNKAVMAALAAVFIWHIAAGNGAPDDRVSYTVKSGDTLWSIAAKNKVGDWEKWLYDVRAANPGLNAGSLAPGDTIKIYKGGF